MSKFFISRPIFAIVISIILVALGVESLVSLPIEQYPNITPPMVSVTATYDGADASVVDNSVATPIGQDVIGVSDMLYMSSTSSNDGSMAMNITFDIGTDPDMNSILTQNRVSRAEALLPDVVKEQGVTTAKMQQNFLMVMSLFSDGRYDSEFLTNYAYLDIRNELLKISGVGGVQVLGSGEYSMRVWLKPDVMAHLGITVSDVVSAIEVQSGLYPMGKLGAEPITNPTEFTYTIVSNAVVNTAEEFGDIILRTTSGGSVVKLKDVADVALGSELYGVTSHYNAQPSATIVMTQSPGSNAVTVGESIVATMETLKTKFPDGLDYATLVNATGVITDGVNEIKYTLIFVIVLVMLIVFLFLQNARATLVPLVAIPVSLVGTFIFFPLLGLSLNIFSLLALVLAVGLVVDDAIVVVEASQLNVEAGMSPMEATREAMRKVSPAIIGTTIVLIAVFLPLAKLSGITGRLFTQFSATIALSFLISSFNALTLSPALCAMLLRKEKEHSKGFFGWFNRVFDKQRGGYMSLAAFLARVPRRALIGVAVALMALVMGLRLVPSGFLPEEDDGYLMMAVNLPPAASVARTEVVCRELEEIVMQNPAVTGVVSVAGYDLLSSTTSSSNGVLFISLKDYSERNVTSFEVADKFNEELYFAINSALTYTFGPPAIPGLGTASGFSLELQDLGANTPQYLSYHAEKFMEEALKRDEIAMINTQYNTNIPQKVLVVNEQEAMKAGVELSELHTLISSYLGGAYVNNFNRFGQLYQTYIEAAGDYRRTEDVLSRLFVTSTSGESVAVSTIAEFRDTVGVQYITRYNLLPSVSITGSQAATYSTGEALAALREVASEVLPEDMTYEWSNMSYQEVNNSGGSMYIFLAIIVFVFLILAALYENWAVPLTVIMGLPFAIFGCLAIIYVAHFFNPVFVNNVYFEISLVVLIALSAKNAILIVEYAHTSFLEGTEVSEAALGALKLRYRPIIMTSLAFMIGALPLVFASGPYSIARNVIGVAMLGGMLATTFFAVVFYPAFYKMISKYVKRVAGVVVLMFMLHSCAVGPNFQSPKLDIPSRLTTDTLPVTSIKPSATANWWSEFGSEELDSLIAKALRNNKDIQVAQLNVASARMSYQNSRSALAPSFSLSTTAEGSYTESTKIQQSYGVSPVMSWEVDLFGGLRRASEASLASSLSKVSAHNASILSVVSSVAETYFSLLEYNAELEIAKQTLTTRRASYELMLKEYMYGLVSRVSLEQSYTLVLSAEIDIESYRYAVKEATNALRVLIGENPSDFKLDPQALHELKPPSLPDKILPVWVVDNRPDVMEAYCEVWQTNAEIGVAVAKRFTKIMLTADGGILYDIIGGETSSIPFSWNVSLSLAQSILNFGENKRNVEIARLTNRAAILEFEQTVLTAFKEVSDAVTNLVALEREVDYYAELVSAQEVVEELTRKLYLGGMSDYLDLLEVDRTLLEARVNYAKAKAQKYIAYVTLYKAVGGTWY